MLYLLKKKNSIISKYLNFKHENFNYGWKWIHWFKPNY